MITYLVIVGVLSFIFGVLFVVAPGRFWNRFFSYLNRPVLDVEEKLRRIHNPLVGIVFVMVGIWLLYLALKIAGFWYFHILGVVVLVLGLFYLFFPGWLFWLSRKTAKEVITLDKVLIASRISFGITLILAAVYIFLRLFLALKVI